MGFQRIYAVFWSPTGTTRRVVTAVAEAAGQAMGLPVQTWDFTLPAQRQGWPPFSSGDLVVFGCPTYAGRVPNVLLTHLHTLAGGGAAAIPVVTYGNRDFDDSLIELRDLLADHGFLPFAAGAFVGEHSFSTTLAAGRPDGEDLALARSLGERAAAYLSTARDLPLIPVDGAPAPYRGYYQPRDRQGTPVSILKVKPQTAGTCTRCGLCAQLCPMGSISPQDPAVYTGICIKCGACVKGCPTGARYYDDPAYLYHKTELEEGLTRRGPVRLFLPQNG